MMNFLGSSMTSLLAQSATQISVSNTNSASWALLLFCVILGLIVALNPSRRTSEIKKHD